MENIFKIEDGYRLVFKHSHEEYESYCLLRDGIEALFVIQKNLSVTLEDLYNSGKVGIRILPNNIGVIVEI